jgi:ribonuclease-3
MNLVSYLASFNLSHPDHEFYQMAFTHHSFLNEHKKGEVNVPSQDYQRLEFIGDSVVGLIVSDYLFKTFPKYSEGDLTLHRSILTRAEGLKQVGVLLKVPDFLQLGFGEVKDNGKAKQNIISDVTEAFIGAIYLLEGITKATEVLMSVIPLIDVNLDVEDLKSAKNRLQELTQGEKKQIPEYKVERLGGNDHNPIYEASCYIQDVFYGKGTAHSKKEAEEKAAKDALTKVAK